MTVFDPKQIRDGLDAFSPQDVTLCAPPLQAYLAHYGLTPLMSRCRYGMGIERIGPLSLVVQLYRPLRPAYGTAILVHGYMDHAGLYRHLVDYLLQHNWRVLIYDLPGHGLSGGGALSIDHFSTYASQLSTLLERHRDGLAGPWVMIGQSTGAAILMEQQRTATAASRQWPVAGRIYLAPLVRPMMLEMIQRKYRWFGRFLKYVKRIYSENSGDPAFVRFVREEDPLQHPYVAVSWVGAMLEWIGQIESSTPLPGEPLVVQGTLDGTVDWRHNVQVLQRLYPSLQLELIDEARHHLVNETLALRQQAFAPIGRLLSRVLRAA
ncbi:alpha/beta hydrolase [Marinobacterium aestuariivivens]|uniref:Alpha/beta hydrolase n=1 Tax=Marinobacterium aestuariivivens TaxID=1698799 RepID=A0ABW1ZYF7_9GAMM